MFEKLLGTKSVGLQDIGDLKLEFEKQLKELILLLEPHSIEDFDLSEAKEFENKFKKRLTSLENSINLASKENLLRSKVANFCKALEKKLSEDIDILEKNQHISQHDISKLTVYGNEIQVTLKNLLDFVIKSPVAEIKGQPELAEIQTKFCEKLDVLFSLDKHVFVKDPFLSEEEGNQTVTGGKHENEMKKSTKFMPKSPQIPSVSIDPEATQAFKLDDKISSEKFVTKSLISKSEDSAPNVKLEYQPQNELNNHKSPFNEDVEKLQEVRNLKNDTGRRFSDIKTNSSALLNETSILSPVFNELKMESHNRSDDSTSIMELSVDNLPTHINGIKREFEFKLQKNLQDDDMTKSTEFLKTEDPKVLSVNTENEVMLESQQNSNFDDIGQGDDPKISESLDVSNNEQIGFKYENNIHNKTTLKKIGENVSKVHKDNVNKEVKKTNEKIVEKGGLEIVKNKLENKSSLAVKKKIKNNAKGVDRLEKNKTKNDTSSKGLKKDSSKKISDYLEDEQIIDVMENKYMDDFRMKSVLNVNEPLYSNKNERLQAFNPPPVLNNHINSISEDNQNSQKQTHINNGRSGDDTIKVVDSKPHDYTLKSNFFSIKSRPDFNESKPSVKLHFTISRRVK